MKNFGTLVGNSADMRKVYSLIEKAASVDMPVFILGETGTGKELVAREIHKRSNRKEKAFVAINMGAVPSELVASELFGHEKGSFTGANDKRVGRFQEAQDGTLFLDEVTTMDEQVQVALLRVLESQKYRRVGGKSDFTTNARILAASNEDPAIALDSNHFRQDLLHRLQVIRITIPPLRKRQKDIGVLAKFFMDEIANSYGHVARILTEETVNILLQYHWPGNVRELRNVIYQAAILAGEEDIAPHHLPQHIHDAIHQEELREANPAIPNMVNPHLPTTKQNGDLSQTPFLNSLMNEGVYLPVGLSMEEVEKAYITKTLSLTGNNKTRAARMLGISRKALYTKLNRWNILEKETHPAFHPEL